MKKKLGLIASLLVVIALLAVGCSGHPRGMKSLRLLTDAEKDRVIEIALNTPEALQAKNTYGSYETSLGWVAISWRGNASDSFGIDYEYDQDKKWITEVVPKSAEWYSRVAIEFGEPPRLLLRVAVNPDTGKVANVELHGLKLPPFTPVK